MAYTTNPHLPKLRMEAVRLVKYRGWSTRAASRYTGYSQSAIVKWCAKDETGGWQRIPTQNSKPRHHPRQLPDEVVAAIVTERLAHGRCAEVIQAALAQRGVKVSLSSVKRTLARQELLKTRTWHRKKRRTVPRPLVTRPGDLVQADTVHLVDLHGYRCYVYTAIDLYSRWAYAEVHRRFNQRLSYQFIDRAQASSGFNFRLVQTDNGPEFGRSFYDQLKEHGIALRHSRVRRSNDNAHIERFNRTIQEECLGRWPSYAETAAKLPEFMRYYNNERLHMSLNFQTPNNVLTIPSY
jgi:transposase InsO family protein